MLHILYTYLWLPIDITDATIRATKLFFFFFVSLNSQIQYIRTTNQNFFIRQNFTKLIAINYQKSSKIWNV